MSTAEKVPGLDDETILAIGAFLLLGGTSSFGARGSISFVHADPQSLPPLLEEEE